MSHGLFPVLIGTNRAPRGPFRAPSRQETRYTLALSFGERRLAAQLQAPTPQPAGRGARLWLGRSTGRHPKLRPGVQGFGSPRGSWTLLAEVCPEFGSWAKAGWVDGLCGSAQDQRLLKRPSPGVTVPWHHLMRLWGSSPGPRRVCHSSSWLPAPALLPGAPIPLSEPWGGLALPRAPPAPGTAPAPCACFTSGLCV